MIKWFKKKFAQWSREAWEAAPKEVVTSNRDSHSATPKVRVGVIDAINGRILEVATATQTHSHYDWKIDMYLVPEGQKLSEAIATVMLMKGLDQ
jgi:hypothetical protein